MDEFGKEKDELLNSKEQLKITIPPGVRGFDFLICINESWRTAMRIRQWIKK